MGSLIEELQSDGPAAPIIDTLGLSLPQTEITIKSISLVSQTQVERSWQWKPAEEVHMAGRVSSQAG